MFIVILNHTDCFLRGTILTSEIDRATRYATSEDAQQAIDRAKPFHKARVNKALCITSDPQHSSELDYLAECVRKYGMPS